MRPAVSAATFPGRHIQQVNSDNRAAAIDCSGSFFPGGHFPIIPNPMMRFSLCLASLAAILGATGTAAAQASWFVDVNALAGGDGSVGAPFQTIGMAIAAAAPSGDAVFISAGQYAESLVLDAKSLDLVAATGALSVVVDAGGSGSVLSIRNHPAGAMTMVRGLELRSGVGTANAAGLVRGGGLLVEGDARTAFEGCSFAGNQALEGGGAYLDGGAHDFVDCTFAQNAADTGGGFLSRGAEIHAMNCRIIDNTSLTGGIAGLAYGVGAALRVPLAPNAPVPTVELMFCDISRNSSSLGSFGGGLFAEVPAIIRNSTFLENAKPSSGSTGGYGGGLFSFQSGVELYDCEFRGNGQRMSRGGGVLGPVVARRCTFAGNEAAEGGGAYRGEYEDCLFVGNTAGRLCCAEGAVGGGAAYATLLGCTLRGNQVIDGIALQGAGAFQSTLRDCVVEHNFQGEVGSGDYRAGGGLNGCTAVDTLIRGNASTVGGGAADCTLVNCELVDNIAWEAGGGAVQSVLTGCLILRNSAGEYGGGVAAMSTLERCVVAGNRASRVGGVAGSELSFCTVTGNTASDQVGGVGSDTVVVGPNFSGSTVMRNSIVYDNLPGNVGEISGTGPGTPVLSADWSLIEGGWPGTGNIDAPGEVAGPLSGNAQLLSASPAIDAADPSAPFDSNGTRADMGAIPFDSSYVPAPTEFCIAKANGQGVVPQIGWAGSPTLSGPDDFTIEGTRLNGRSFALVAAAPAAAYTSAFGGTICVGAGTVRLGVVATGGTLGSANGAFALGLDQAELATFGAGSLVYTQLLVRDPNHPDGSGAALTAALEFRVLP